MRLKHATDLDHKEKLFLISGLFCYPETNLMKFNYYHGHFYFETNTLSSAEIIRQKMLLDLPQIIRVFHLLAKVVGPHPLPMFEFHFRGSDYETVKNWLVKNHGNHSVLIHPLSGDEIADHTTYAEFIGPVLPLNVQFLIQLKGAF